MAKLGSTTIYGKLKSVGEALVQGVLRVKNGIEVEGSDQHNYAGIRAGPDANNGHLMLDSRGGNLYLNWEDGGQVRIYNGRLETDLDGDGFNITNVSINGYEIQKNGTDGNGIINFKT